MDMYGLPASNSRYPAGFLNHEVVVLLAHMNVRTFSNKGYNNTSGVCVLGS
jgi:hypothetical protein